MKFCLFTDRRVMELVRFFIRSALLTPLVLMALAGCSGDKRKPPDDGDGEFSKKSVTNCEAYLACAATQGPALMAAWGVSSELQQALLSSCADSDVSALSDNARSAQAQLVAECGL